MVKTIEQGLKDKETKTPDVRKLEKLGNDKFKLTVENTGQKVITVKEYNKSELHEVYKELKGQLAQTEYGYKEEKRKAKILSDMSDEEQAEIVDFIDKLNNAKQFADAKKAMESLPNFDKAIEDLTKAKKEIETLVPEFTRD